MNQAKPVSIIVPTLNEADNLELLFERIDRSMNHSRIPYEIIVIDDKSTDATKAIAESADDKYAVSVETKRGKPGKAYSLLEGFALARYDIVCMIDADLQYPPEAIASMYHKMQFCDADIVITNRIDHQTSLLRKFVSGTFHTVFTRGLFGINYDTQSGLKLFKKEVLENIDIQPTAWSFDMEFIVRSLEKNYVIVSEDILFSERNAGDAKIHIVTASLEIAWQSLKLRRSTSSRQVKAQFKRLKPLQRQSARAFNVIAGAIVAVGLFSMVTTAHTSAASQTATPGSTGVLSPLNIITDPLQNLLHVITGTPAATAVTPTQPTSQQSGQAGTITASSQTTTTANTSTASSTPVSTTLPTATTAKTAASNPQITTASSTAASTDPTTLTPQTATKADYYPASRLTSDKTNQFLRFSLLSLEVGASLLAFGILMVGLKKFRSKVHKKHPVWNN